jgi:hypothetical protein
MWNITNAGRGSNKISATGNDRVEGLESRTAILFDMTHRRILVENPAAWWGFPDRYGDSVFSN